MEKYTIENNLTVFGNEVNTFPNGVAETFNELMKQLPPGDERPYYGIGNYRNGKMVYIAAALETFEGEGKKYGYHNYTINKGEYLAETLMDWTSNTHRIKDVFATIVKDERADSTKPAIEFYTNMKEMVCMVMMKQ